MMKINNYFKITNTIIHFINNSNNKCRIKNNLIKTK